MNRLVTNHEWESVNLWIDEPFEILGPHHRQARHSPIELVARYMDNQSALNAAFTHVIIDEMGTADPHFRMLLDAMGMWTDAMQKQERVKAQIAQLRMEGKDISVKLQEQADINHSVELAGMSLMLAMLPW